MRAVGRAPHRGSGSGRLAEGPAAGHYSTMNRATGRFLALITVVVMPTLLAGCGKSGHGAASPTTATSVTTAVPSASSTVVPSVPSTVAPTTTTVYVPTAPQPSAESAAARLVQFWSSGARSQAASVAAPAAVAALFAAPYPGGDLAIDRGCSSSVPIICTFGPPGGADPNDAIYEITTTETPQGSWYVTAVTVEG